jgi:hypothetical protein
MKKWTHVALVMQASTAPKSESALIRRHGPTAHTAHSPDVDLAILVDGRRAAQVQGQQRSVQGGHVLCVGSMADSKRWH